MMNSVKLYTRNVILIRWLLRRLIKDQLQTKSLKTDSICSEKVCYPFVCLKALMGYFGKQ